MSRGRLTAKCVGGAALVSALDGLPLAIELAAVRARFMSLPQMGSQLREQRFALLSQSRPGRHASLQQAIAWSWELLSPAEQRTLAHCSVFCGRFSLEAAEAVVARPPGAPPLMDILHALVDHSLLESSDGGFGFLLSIRAFAEDVLSETDREAAEERHGVYFTSGWDVRDFMPHDRATFVEPPLQEVLAAGRRAVRREAAATAALAASIQASVALQRGPFMAGIAQLGEVLALRPPADLAARLHWDRAALRERSGDFVGAVQDLTAALQGASWATGLIQVVMARVAQQQGHIKEARRWLETAHEAVQESSDQLVQAVYLNCRSALLFHEGAVADAVTDQEASWGIHRAMGSPRSQIANLLNLASKMQVLGQLSMAVEYAHKALLMSVSHNERRMEGISLSALADLALLRGELPLAQTRYREAHAIHKRVGNRRFEAMSLGYLALARWKVLKREGKPLSMELAGDFQQALALHRANDDGRQTAATLVNLGEAWLCSRQLVRARQCFAEAQRANRAYSDPVIEGCVLGNLGRLALAEGRTLEGTAQINSGRTMLHKAGAWLSEVGLLSDIGLDALGRGDHEAARVALASASEVFERASVSMGAAAPLVLQQLRERLVSAVPNGRSAMDTPSSDIR